MKFSKFILEQDIKKYNKEYNHSKEGRLTRMYHRMDHRNNNKLPFSKDEFVKYGMKSKKYNDLFDAWSKSGYKYGKTPTVDRKDYKKGYTLSNIQFLSFEENREKQTKEYSNEKNKKGE